MVFSAPRSADYITLLTSLETRQTGRDNLDLGIAILQFQSYEFPRKHIEQLASDGLMGKLSV
jgi:hypothetical protein